MKLKDNGTEMYLSDQDPRVVKILQGYSWSIDDGELKVGTKTEYDLTAFETKLNTGTQTASDIANFLKQLLIIYKTIKYQ